MSRRYRPMTSRWTPKSALARMERRVQEAKDALTDISAVWGDVDQGVVFEVDRLIEELTQLASNQRQYVQERLDAGEHVGP